MSASTVSWADYEGRIISANSSAKIDALDHELFGRKAGLLTEALKTLKDLPEEKKREAAKDLNAWKKKFTELIEGKRKELSGTSGDDAIDVTLTLPRPERGHAHLIPEFIRQVEEVFGRMGFDVAYGPEVETEDMNFNMLNIPKEHPDRDS